LTLAGKVLLEEARSNLWKSLIILATRFKKIGFFPKASGFMA
jgi:hypothetical protein